MVVKFNLHKFVRACWNIVVCLYYLAGSKISSKQKKPVGNGGQQTLNPKEIDSLYAADSRPPSHNLPYV